MSNGNDQLERAMNKVRAGDLPYDVAAVLVGASGPADLDGARWRFVVTDGRTEDSLDAGLSGTQGGERGMQIDRSTLEAAVEKRAGRFARESRLADLVAESPLTLTREELGFGSRS